MGFIVFQYQKPNALNMNKGLLIKYNDQRKLEKTLRILAVASKWGNFFQYFTESGVPDSSCLGSLAEKIATAHVWAHWQKKKKLASIA